MLILKGNIISSDGFDKLSIYENSFLVSDDNGSIVGIFKDLPKEYQKEKVVDYKDALIMQSFSDMHLHAPQYPMLGMGMDLELIDWLNTYTILASSLFLKWASVGKV